MLAFLFLDLFVKVAFISSTRGIIHWEWMCKFTVKNCKTNGNTPGRIYILGKWEEFQS